MNYVLEYWRAIDGGKITASARVKRIYKKLAQEIEYAEKWRFDEELGNRPIEFIERFCKQSKGAWFGKSVELQLFQKAYIQALFGFIDEDGLRRFRETLFLVGRKNGKSTMMAGLALYLLMADGEGGAEVYSVATKRDQAKLIFNEAVNMVRQSETLAKRLKKRKTDLHFPHAMATFAPLASDSNTLDGLNTHGVIIDELHAIKDVNLYEVMKQSVTARRQPLVCMITTAGKVRECIFDQMYDYAADVADGKIEDERFLPILYELDSHTEWVNPKCWQKANPGLGTIKNRDQLADLVKRAKKDKSFRPGLLCKDFNVRETETAAWLSYEEINNPATFEMSEVYDTYAIGGCDLSATTDLTCATLLIRNRDDETVYVLQHYFLPEARIRAIDQSSVNEAPYWKWSECGLLTICEGTMVDYSQVTKWFADMSETHKINPLWVCYDRALAGYWVQEMESHGFVMERIPQGPFTWSQPMKEMGATLAAKKVNYNSNPILKWCLSNTGIKTLNKDGIASIQPVKLGVPRRIDGTVSLLNAWVGYVRHYDEYMAIVG